MISMTAFLIIVAIVTAATAAIRIARIIANRPRPLDLNCPDLADCYRVSVREYVGNGAYMHRRPEDVDAEINRRLAAYCKARNINPTTVYTAT